MTMVNALIRANEARIVTDTARYQADGTPDEPQIKTHHLPGLGCVMFGRGSESIVNRAVELVREADVEDFDELVKNLPAAAERAYQDEVDQLTFGGTISFADVVGQAGPAAQLAIQHEIYAIGFSQQEGTMIAAAVLSYDDQPIHIWRPIELIGNDPGAIQDAVKKIGRIPETDEEQKAILHRQFHSERKKMAKTGHKNPVGGGDVTLTILKPHGQISRRSVGDIDDVQRLQASPQPARKSHKVGRNERCPCGSGKKYKRCCGAQAAA